MKTHFDLYEKGADGKLTEYKNPHPIKEIFAYPNEYQNFKAILYSIPVQFGLFGTAYLLKLRDQFEIMRGLMLLPYNSVKVYATKTPCDYYEISTSGGVVRYDKSEIIRIDYPDPISTVKGRAIIENILDISEVDQLQTGYMKRFYERGGFMGLTFVNDNTLQKDIFDRAKAELQRNYGGKDNSYKVGLLDSGFKPVTTTHSIKELDIKNQRDLTRDEILSAFQISKFQLGMGENINRATAVENALRFYGDVIEPLLTYIDSILTQSICKVEKGWEYLEIKHESLSPRDLDSDLKWYSDMTKVGAITPNEIREMEDFEPIGDERMNEPIIFNNLKINNNGTEQRTDAST